MPRRKPPIRYMAQRVDRTGFREVTRAEIARRTTAARFRLKYYGQSGDESTNDLTYWYHLVNGDKK